MQGTSSVTSMAKLMLKAALIGCLSIRFAQIHASFTHEIRNMPQLDSFTESMASLALGVGDGNTKSYDVKVYQQAMTYLDSLRDSPSCHRLAARTMINTCQNLESDQPVELALSEVKEEYAARHAVCELSTVMRSENEAIPPACARLLPSKDACAKTKRASGRSKMASTTEDDKMCILEVSRPLVTQCIQSLHTRPQSWTSYSNAAQNVQSVCHMTRLATQKDQTIDAVLRAVSVAERADVAMATTIAELEMSLDRYRRIQDDILSSTKDRQQDLLEEFAAVARRRFFDTFTDVAGFWEQYREALEAQADEILQKNSLGLQRLEHQLTVMNSLTDAIGATAEVLVNIDNKTVHLHGMFSTISSSIDTIGSLKTYLLIIIGLIATITLPIGAAFIPRWAFLILVAFYGIYTMAIAAPVLLDSFLHSITGLLKYLENLQRIRMSLLVTIFVASVAISLSHAAWRTSPRSGRARIGNSKPHLLTVGFDAIVREEAFDRFGGQAAIRRTRTRWSPSQSRHNVGEISRSARAQTDFH